jgi:beta-glucosidase
MDTLRINDAVSRVLTAKFDLGLFEQPYAKQSMNPDSLLTAGHQLAQKVAEESIVLLKNEKCTLPLNLSIESIAVFGEDAVLARLGGYSGPGFQVVSILDGIKGAFPNTEFSFEQGAFLKDTSIYVIPSSYFPTNGNPGFLGEYFNNTKLEGVPEFTRRDEKIDFHWTLYGPHASINPHFYSVRWTGAFKASNSEDLSIGLEGNDGYRLYINDKLLIDRWEKQSFHQDFVDYSFKKNVKYAIRIEFKESQGNGLIKFISKRVNEKEKKAQFKRIVKKSKSAKANIVVVGIEEGEFNDRASLRLTESQEQLIHTVAKNGNNTIVVLVGGSAVNMESWIEEVNGILTVWYPGEAGGTAVANILNGKVNPSGKLPITYPMNEAQLPLVYNHLPTGRGDDYRNLSGEPLFPFGFGLSYTNFAYSNLSVTPEKQQAHGNISISVDVTNTGKFNGDEVVQLYLKDEISSVTVYDTQLRGFERIALNVGETKTVHFVLSPDDLKLLDKKMRWVVEPGVFEVLIGSSSEDIKVKKQFTIIE